jgi:hypothetical protein
MKVLFSMRHSGALRNFASTVEELARRGHQIHLTFMMRDKLADQRLLEGLTAQFPDITHGFADVSRRAWLGMARAIRATGDYLRYQAPEYRDATALYDRAAARVSPVMQRVSRLPIVRTTRGRKSLRRALQVIERTIPPDPAIVRLLASHKPDVVLVTPLIELGSDQVEYVKAARALGIPCGLCVHSWDNLTNKGLIHVVPDVVFVWNDAQLHEADALHGVPSSQVVVTGAPTYDQWFTRGPSTTRDEFCQKVGLPSGRPYFLYLCSSKFIAPREAAFITRWIRALRSATDVRVREAGVLVRPHPRGDMRGLDGPELRGMSDAAVWPPQGGNPVDVNSKNDYFDSLYHSVAAVGINTSAQIEAGIVGKPVYSIRAPEYQTTQEGTLHFHYLLNAHGGLLQMASTFDEHTRALATALDRTTGDEGRLREFVKGFVRPHGLDVAATPLLANGIEALARSGEALARSPARAVARRASFGTHLLRMALYPVATRMKTERPVTRRRASSPAPRQERPVGA